MAIARAFPHGCVADCPPSVRYHSDNVLFCCALQTFIGICGSTCHGRKCEYWLLGVNGNSCCIPTLRWSHGKGNSWADSGLSLFFSWRYENEQIDDNPCRHFH